MSILRMRFEGEQFDFQKNKNIAYWQESIYINADYMPPIDFFSNRNITLGSLGFDLLKLDKNKLSREIIEVIDTTILDPTWITTELSDITNRYRVYLNDLYEFDVEYDLEEVYQLRVTLNTEGEIWYSEPFYQSDYSERIPRFFSFTTNQSVLQTVGIYLKFASGSVRADWGDGSPLQSFTSEVELTKNYSITGTYEIKIYSQTLENITIVRADNSRISAVDLLELSQLTDLRLNQNMITGIIDLPPMTGLLYLNQNQLSGFNFQSSGNGQLTLLWGYLNSNSFTTADFSNMPISGNFSLHTLGFLSSIIFASSGNGLVTLWNTSSTALSTIDLATPNIPVSGTFHCHSNVSLTSIIFASSGNATVNSFFSYSVNVGTLDFTNVPIGGDFRVYNNFSLTSLTFSLSGNSSLTRFYAYSTNITNVDFSVFATSDGVDIQITSCSFTAIEHDNQLINLDSTGWINGSLQIIAGNTARTAASDTAYNNLIAKGWSIK